MNRVSMFAERIASYQSRVLSYEDPAVRQACLKVLPLERLLSEANDVTELAAEMEEPTPKELPLLDALTRWFKVEFFSWVSSPSCWNCGNAETIHVATLSSGVYKHGASRIERYRCPKCQADIDFPRYNDPVKLLETRRGRCGEWANAFTCICRALDLEARLVIDWTDHVWTEVYIPDQNRWIHVDCCECIVDKPMLYDDGWGQKVSYVVAFDRYGVHDVSKRYIQDWTAALQRREIPEPELERLLTDARSQIRRGLDEALIQQLEERDRQESIDLNEGPQRTNEALPGRTTGSVEWRQSRGELGKASTERALRASSSPYRRATLNGGQGIIIRASGENSPNEIASCLFDGRTNTKWLDFGGGGRDGSAWIEIQLVKNAPDVEVHGYVLTSANDYPKRDPAEWELQGATTGDQEWRCLDRRSNVVFDHRHERKTFRLEKPVAVRKLRLCIWSTRIPSKADSMQLAHFEILQSGLPGQASNPWMALFDAHPSS